MKNEEWRLDGVSGQIGNEREQMSKRHTVDTWTGDGQNSARQNVNIIHTLLAHHHSLRDVHVDIIIQDSFQLPTRCIGRGAHVHALDMHCLSYSCHILCIYRIWYL